MADDEEKQRRLEAKREYNRVLSAQKRQRIKDETAALATEAEFQAERANKAEEKNTELLQQIQVLTAEHQRLSDRIQYLTSRSSANISSMGGGGLGPDLATATLGAAAGSAPPLSTVDQRYLQLAGLLSETASSNGGGGGSGVDPAVIGGSSISSNLAALPRSSSEQQSSLLLGQLLASSLYQYDTSAAGRQLALNPELELELLLRLNNATRNNNNANSTCFPNDNTFLGATTGIFPPRGSESLIQQRGISATSGTPLSELRLPYTSTMDPLLVAQLLGGGAGARASPRSSEDIPSEFNSGAQSAQLLRQQAAAAAAAAFLTGSSQSASTGFLDQQQGSTTSNPSRNE